MTATTIEAPAGAALTIIPPEQHDRQKFLGGSDIASVIGISPWRSPLKLWEDKIKPRAPQSDTAVQKRAKKRGVRWEAVVAEMLVERLEEEGHKVEIVSSNRRYQDSEHPFLAAEIDFELRLDDEEEITNAELKTVHPFKMKEWGDSGSDDLPTHYTAQVMHGLGVTPGRKRGILAALFGADELRTYPVPRDDAVIQYLRSRAVAFWHDHVLAGVAPDPIDLNDLSRLYPKELEGGQPLLADEALIETLMRMRAISREIGARQAEFDALEFQVKRAMKDAVAIVLPSGSVACDWKYREGKSLDHEAVKAALGVKGYQAAHKPWQSRVFTLKGFSIDGL